MATLLRELRPRLRRAIDQGLRTRSVRYAAEAFFADFGSMVGPCLEFENFAFRCGVAVDPWHEYAHHLAETTELSYTNAHRICEARICDRAEFCEMGRVVRIEGSPRRAEVARCQAPKGHEERPCYRQPPPRSGHYQPHDALVFEGDEWMPIGQVRFTARHIDGPSTQAAYGRIERIDPDDPPWQPEPLGERPKIFKGKREG